MISSMSCCKPFPMQYCASLAPNAKIATILPQFTPSRKTSSATCTNFVCAEPFTTFSLLHMLERTTEWRSSSSSESLRRIAAVRVGGGVPFPIRYDTRSWARFLASSLTRRISSPTVPALSCTTLVGCKQLISWTPLYVSCVSVQLNSSDFYRTHAYVISYLLGIALIKADNYCCTAEVNPLSATCYVHKTGFPVLTGCSREINARDWLMDVWINFIVGSIHVNAWCKVEFIHFL